jgi:hypothetical protein
MPHLQSINIGGNLINSIPTNYFKNNTALTAAYINNNNFTTLPLGLLDNAKNLRYLDASNNLFATVPFSTIPAGCTVNLSDTLIPSSTYESIKGTYPKVNFSFNKK